ncbi:MAG: hypothetical protein WCV71_03340 [Patescibacteria group bacterium]
MFEHLGPVPEVRMSKKETNYKLYLSLLFFSVVVFVFSMGVSRGPSSKAEESATLSAQVFVDSSDKKIVSTAKNFSVFDFVIDINQNNTSLYKLNILANGVYDLNVIGDLKLFHEGVQLGQIDKMDQNGKIYFDLAEYQLKAGKNTFSLFFNNGDSLSPGLALSFSISDQEDIFLIKDGHVFRPQADFPIAGGLVSVLEKGEALASNLYVVNDFLINSDVPQQVASFELSSIGEKLDLRQIKLSYQDLESDDYPDLDFVLIHNKQPLAQATSRQGEIIFVLPETIILQDLQREQFDLHVIAMPVGRYQFFIKDILAQGALSGLDISLLDKLALSSVEASKYFIQLQAGDLDKKLSAGWNKIYSLNIKTKGIDKAYLDRITWQIDKQNLDIESVEIWKNGQPYIANVVLKDNMIIVKTDASNPLEISQTDTEISLLANIVNLEPKAKIEAFVLPDYQPIDEDLLLGNIIWSDGENFYNSYKIPYLPLEPSILAN